MALLDKVKVACRVTSDVFDDELTDMIDAGLADMGITDINPILLQLNDEDDQENTLYPLIQRAVITYCKMNFGFANMPEYQYDRMKDSYDEQKKQLLMSSDYNRWGVPPIPGDEEMACLTVESG